MILLKIYLEKFYVPNKEEIMGEKRKKWEREEKNRKQERENSER